jgi:hypothetical protein
MPDSTALRRAELAVALPVACAVLLVLLPGVDALRFHARTAAGLAPIAFAGAVLVVAAHAAVRFAAARRAALAALGPVREAELEGHRVRIVATPVPLALCAGSLRPRIHVSHGALALLSRAELHAVLAHEAHHARRRDPLRALLCHAAAAPFARLPGFGCLGRRHAGVADLAADVAAARAAGGAALAGALLRFDALPAGGVAPERVDQLVGVAPAVPLRRLLPAALATLLLLAAVAATAAGADHLGLPAPAAPFDGLTAAGAAVLATAPALRAVLRP